MYTRIAAEDMESLMLPVSRREGGSGVYYVRLCESSPRILDGLWAYYEAALRRGVIIEGQIANPDERQMSYLTDTLGSNFKPQTEFILRALEIWMPRMSRQHREEFSGALTAQFDVLRGKGKNDSVLRNIYFKMMCWLYYRFERLMPFLGEDDPPRILYESSTITGHEFIFLNILSSMGADILLLESRGESAYLKQDPASQFSQLLSLNGKPFDETFTLKEFRKTRLAGRNSAPQTENRGNPVQHSVPSQPLKIVPENRFPKPSCAACTNAWMTEAEYTQILTPVSSRGDDFRLFYNAFIRVKGVRDKTAYINDLYRFYQQLQGTGRNVVIVDDALPVPDAEETAKVRRHSYRTPEELIVDLAGNLPACANTDLQKMMQQAFVQVMKKAAESEPNVNRLVTSGVYLICWIRQYQGALFQEYKEKEVSCFILMGGCRNKHDSLYLLFLSKIPVDVLILAPDLNRVCRLQDETLLEITGEDSLPVQPFPRGSGTVQMRTMASSAEQDLGAVLYSDTGLYRSRQFASAEAITLRTTYDEIFILWNQEMKYRPNFSTNAQTVNMPVIYAKISGVENGNVDAYWQKIRQLLGKDTCLVKSFPLHLSGEGSPFQPLAVRTLRNGKIRREEIKEDRQYPFGLYREELQEHIFDKLQLMLDRRLIRGTFVNGTEYTVVSTVLNMKKNILRMLQSFDFTKKNPKIVCLSTGDSAASLEDTIMLTFLNLIGFDIVVFVPTGYQAVERYLNDNYPVEHQAGDYLYDLHVPDFDNLPPPKGRSWFDQIFRRGNE